MISETEMPERIWMSPKDAALFAQKYGHPDVPQPTVGDGFVSYVLSDAKRIEEFEAEQAEADRLLDECQGIILRYKTNREELEAKLAKAIEVLERIAHASDVYGVEANAEDQGADTLAYAHKSTCNLARAAIAELADTTATRG